MGIKYIECKNIYAPKSTLGKVIYFKDDDERKRFIELYKDSIYIYRYSCINDEGSNWEGKIAIHITINKNSFESIVKDMNLIPINPPRTRIWRTEGARA